MSSHSRLLVRTMRYEKPWNRKAYIRNSSLDSAVYTFKPNLNKITNVLINNRTGISNLKATKNLTTP